MSTFSAKDNIMSEYTQKKGLYEHLSASILQITEGLMKKDGIKYASAVYRIKDADSLSEKIRRKGEKYKTLSDITDIGGVRIITYYADDVDRVAELIEREFKVDKENSIDKRKTLEPNVFGYLSLHYVICLDDRRAVLPEYENLGKLKIEVQIRSILQHSWAEMEHDMGYKSNIEVPSEIVRDFSRLAGLLEMADKEFQEIRQKISKYELEVSEKIQSDEQGEEVRLDAVSLQILLDTDKGYISLNQEIMDCTGIEIDSVAENIQSALNKCRWLGIKTVGDVKLLLEHKKDLAVGLAKKILDDNVDSIFYNSIGMFYLCYAELVTEYSKQRWQDYLRENHIGREEECTQIVEKLSKVYQEISE
ncbi:MAG: GTP pyrophosphokinase [Lachnospiraceae bacterium]|nr:GTP pyrophosphokinase [Lachnospiraceae bacterium]